MDRKRVHDEVVEILSHKLQNLPPLHPDEIFDYNNQNIIPEITSDPLDIAEIAMDIEDAFGMNFEEILPGDASMETVGLVVDYIYKVLQEREATMV